MDFLPLLLGVSVLLPLACGHYDVFIPRKTLCDLTSNTLCRHKYAIIQGGQKPRLKLMFTMSLPAIPTRVEKVTFAWKRTTVQQVTYDINVTSHDHAAMAMPTLRNAPMKGELPSETAYVDLLFHCTGLFERTVPFTIKACFKEQSENSRMCTKATLRKACPLQQRDCAVQCFNGGRCMDRYRKEKCICPEGFSGRQCERRDLSRLKSSKWCPIGCSKQGTMHCSRAKLRCVCKAGYKGAFCQHKKRPRKLCGGVCQNGGRCNFATRTCTCPLNYIGPFCHKKIAFKPPEPKEVKTSSTWHHSISGQDVHLECGEQSGQPLSGTWYFVDGENSHRPLRTHDRISINGSHLLITKTSTADSGEYICKATDSNNVLWRASTLLDVVAAKEGSGSGSGAREGDDEEA